MKWKGAVICRKAVTPVLVLVLLIQPIWGSKRINAEETDDPSTYHSRKIDTGIKVAAVSHATVTTEEMRQRDEALRKLELAPRVSASPFLPDPNLLPVSPGTIPDDFLESQATPSAPPEPPPAPMAPALAMSFEALPDNGTRIPPDTNGAVGPNHLMVPLNSEVRIQTKTGSVVSTVSLSSFWSSLGVSDVFDPKVIYDPDSGRFIFVTCAERRSDDSSMLLAVSDDSDPTGTWDMWKLDGDSTDTNWVDYPNLGVNGNWITFTSNMYSVSDDAFDGVNIWVVDKPWLLSTGVCVSTLFFETGVGGTHVPCLTYSSAELTQYLVNRWNSSLGMLRLYTITGTASSPTWTATFFYPSSSPWNYSFPDAPQLGSAHNIETNDPRIMNAVLRNGSLWCTHTIALPATGTASRTAAKWWQINPVTGVVVQSGVVEDTTSGMFYYFPSIAVNKNDEVLMGFSGSSSLTYAGGYYTYRNLATPVGTMQPVSLVKAGESPYYKTFGSDRNRWGDYSATCVDPSDDETMWTIQEYADSQSNMWSTWWGKTKKTVSVCEGDFEPDGDVDGSDLAVFAADFGRTDCDQGETCEGDFDGDNDVDGSDLATFAAEFGRTDCP